MEIFDKEAFDRDVENAMKNKYLTFSVNDEDYAIEIKYVIEIVRVLEITPMPDFPDYIEGVINLRGKIIPIINLRKRLGAPECEFGDKTCFVILKLDEKLIGFVVDSISEVMDITEENIVETPMMSGASTSFVSFVAKVNDAIKLVLDCEEIVKA